MKIKENQIIEEDIIEICKEIPGKHFQNKTILISGASGFLASYLVKYFLYLNSLNSNQETKVIGLVRNIEKAKDRFKAYLEDPMLELFNHDVNKKLDIKDSINFIIHAASQASPKYYKDDPVGTLKPNVLGTINLLDLSLKKNLDAFLYFSSSEVYGNNNSISIGENQYGILDPINIRSCYSEAKRMGENICLSYGSQFGVNVKIVRPFHIYGPGMSLDDGRVYADFTKNLLDEADLIINSDGKAIRSFCYLKDATIGFLKVMLNGKKGHPYNIGNPNESYSIKELADILSKDSSGSSPNVIINQPQSKSYIKSSVSIHAPNIDRVERIGWSPKTDIRTGFQRTVKSYN